MPPSTGSDSASYGHLRADSRDEGGEEKDGDMPDRLYTNGSAEDGEQHSKGEATEWTKAEISGGSASPSSTSGACWPALRLSLLVLVALCVLAVGFDVFRNDGQSSSEVLRQLQALPSSFGPLAYNQLGVGRLEEDVEEGEQAASSRLSPGERELVSILTGADGVLTLPSALLRRLRQSMQLLAAAVLVLRPSLQREFWLSSCRSHTPCPSPNAALRRASSGVITDETVRQELTSRPVLLAAVMDSWFNPPDPESLFHTNQPPPPPATTSNDTSSSPPTSPEPLSPSSASDTPLSTLHFAPGEVAEAQALSQRFQRELYARQHPANCSAEKWLIMDFYHAGGGFGSWNHARSIPMAIAIRSGRLLIEAPLPPNAGQWAYSIPWNDCVKVKGMGGCDIFLAASNCTLPDDWRDFALAEQAQYASSRPGYTGTGVDGLLEWYAGRRFLIYTEISGQIGEKWELHHHQAKEWDEVSLYSFLPPHLQPYRQMPECWWMRQIMSYHQRMTRYGITRLLPLLTRTLQLPEPNITAAVVLRFADQRAPSLEQTSHWWLSIQALKLTWQLQQIDSGLAQALRRQLLPASDIDPAVHGPPSPWAAEAASFLNRSHTRIPLLGYTFVRHGDKGAEVGLMPDHEYLRQANVMAEAHGLRQWYVGADSLFSADAIRALNVAAVDPLHLYTSIQTDETADKEHAPFAAGFDKDMSFGRPDSEKEPIVWNTLIHHGIAQVSDVFLSSWSSNHVRFSYEMATTLSEARAMAPFFAMDAYKYLITKEGCTP